MLSHYCIHTENQNQVSFYPFVLNEISVLIELTLGNKSSPQAIFLTDIVGETTRMVIPF